MTTWTVGQVADVFGVTVRTLHHYDEIGLLTPSERSRAGYRLYTDEDLTRLQQIVVSDGSRCRWRRSRRCSSATRTPWPTCVGNVKRS